jgi:hypothetical protein
VIPAIVAILVLAAICAVLLVENRRLTNLVVAKNPEAMIVAERLGKKKKTDDKPRKTWETPSEAVGP